jgi:hypothetical protein
MFIVKAGVINILAQNNCTYRTLIGKIYGGIVEIGEFPISILAGSKHTAY